MGQDTSIRGKSTNNTIRATISFFKSCFHSAETNPTIEEIVAKTMRNSTLILMDIVLVRMEEISRNADTPITTDNIKRIFLLKLYLGFREK